MKWVLRVLFVAVGSLYVVLAGLALLSDKIIFQPQQPSYTDRSLRDSVSQTARGELVHIASGGQRITAIYLPNLDAKYTLLFSHGNAEDLGDLLPMFEMYRHAGFAVFAYDYRGYGTSTGHPTENGAYEDIAAAYRYATENLHIAPNHLISMGRSVGCGPAIQLAATRPVAGLIAESPFMSAFRVLTRVPMVPWDKFNNVREIRKVHVPVLIIHGRKDGVVPFWHGVHVFRAANEPKQFIAVDEAGHNDIMFIAGKKYFEGLQQFASRVSASAGQPVR